MNGQLISTILQLIYETLTVDEVEELEVSLRRLVNRDMDEDALECELRSLELLGRAQANRG